MPQTSEPLRALLQKNRDRETSGLGPVRSARGTAQSQLARCHDSEALPWWSDTEVQRSAVTVGGRPGRNPMAPRSTPCGARLRRVGDEVGGLVTEAPVARTAASTRPPPGSSGAARGSSGCRLRVNPWARPVLLVVAGLAFFSYSWESGSAQLETFYGAAVRSMAQSWHNFFFGAFDPWGTVSVDKLPGALLGAGPLGPPLRLPHLGHRPATGHEGALTVLVLYRAVRRVAGAGGGLVAAAALAATPVTILLEPRQHFGHAPDSAAGVGGGRRPLLRC